MLLYLGTEGVPNNQGPFGCKKESEEIESKRVKMESRGKLGNDEKVKFVGPSKNVRWIEKACGSYVNYPKTITFHTF